MFAPCQAAGSSYGHTWSPWHMDTIVQESSVHIPNQHFPRYLHAPEPGTQSWGNATQPHGAELDVPVLCCGDLRSGPARRQSSEHCARRGDAAGAAAGRAGHRASPRAELDHFSSAARANSPRRCSDIAWGLALPSSGSHLHPARSCASKPALTRAPQPQGLVWEEGAGSETPCPKRRIWLAPVHPAWLRGFPPWLGRSAAKPSATAQPPRAGPPWGHTTTIPEARCGLYNGYHGDPVPGDARPTSDHRPAPARSPSQFVSPTLPHAVQATFPKGEVTSKLPCHGTATPCLPPSLPPPAVLTDTPK